MREHHRRTVERLTARFQTDPNVLALLIGGSIARGWERADSDVDFLLIVNEEEYARRAGLGDFNYFSTEDCDWEGGYADGKVLNLAFLEEVADHGSEPARAAFVNVEAAFSRLPGLPGLLERITTYPETERAEKMRSFYAQVLALQWFMGEAEKRADRYLRAHAAADLALFSGRLILAHNRILFPFHKWFTTALREAPQKPDGLLEAMDALLEQPSKATADRLVELVLGFTKWEEPPQGWPGQFMEDVEWSWRRGRPALEDW